MNKSYKLTTVLIFLLSILVLSVRVSAANSLYHGANCSGINVVQNAFFSKSIDGLVNNYVSDLFVYCPVIFDVTDANPNPQFDIEISMALPSSYLNTDTIAFFTTGPKCGFRVRGILTSLPNVFGDSFAGTRLSNSAGILLSTITLGRPPHGYIATGKTTTARTFGGISGQNSAHIICLVPEGATILQYSFSPL